MARHGRGVSACLQTQALRGLEASLLQFIFLGSLSMARLKPPYSRDRAIYQPP
jgi:hypothetical protein